MGSYVPSLNYFTDIPVKGKTILFSLITVIAHDSKFGILTLALYHFWDLESIPIAMLGPASEYGQREKVQFSVL